MDKKSLSERDICTKFITPGALVNRCVKKAQAAFSSGTWLTGTPLTYSAPW